MLDAQVAIGSSGAPTIASGNGYGIASITRMSAGKYRIRLQDNFAKLLGFQANMVSPVSGAGVAAGSLSVGTVYQISSMGNTTQAQWVTAGVPSGITAAVGVVFKCAATSAGTGEAKVLGSSGIAAVELLGVSNNMLNYQPYIDGSGGYIDFQCLGPSLAMNAYTPAGTVASHTHSFTPEGEVESHTHSIPPGTDGAGGTSGATEPSFTGDAGTTGATAPAFSGTEATLTGAVSYVAADPADGSSILLRLFISNSQVQ